MRHVNTHVTRSRTSLFVLKISGFHVKLSTRNRVHSPADSLGRFTPRAHALKGVLPNSASPDACEPSGRSQRPVCQRSVSGFTPKTPYIILLPFRKNKTAQKLLRNRLLSCVHCADGARDHHQSSNTVCLEPYPLVHIRLSIAASPGSVMQFFH